MTDILFTNMILIFLMAAAVMYICVRLHIPTVVGLLLTGIIVGPGGIGLIDVTQQTEAIADIGVILLLFTIGLEFSLKRLMKLLRMVLLGGFLQVSITTGIVYFIAVNFGVSKPEALFAGFIVSMSSTAIAMKLLQERGQIESQTGGSALSISLFQDIMSVPMVLAIPLLIGAGKDSGGQLGMFFLQSSAIILFVFLGARWIVPAILYQVAKTRSQELFLFTILCLCGAITWLTSMVDLSIALGAFLAGLIISESDYDYQALGAILPFRDLFTGFFFISMGMLLNVDFFLGNPLMVAMIAVGIVALKIIVIVSACVILGLPLAVGIVTGFAISNIGEFSFVLIREGSSAGLVSDHMSQLFLTVAVISMIIAPFLMATSKKVSEVVKSMPIPEGLKAGIFNIAGISGLEVIEKKVAHIIIVGYGINGRNVARAASIACIPYNIIEMNPDTVKREQSRGEPIIFGSADHPAILEGAGVSTARALVVCIADIHSTRLVVTAARRANPDIYIIARTRYMQEVQPLYEMGANEVIPEEFETSVEIFVRVLKKYLIPANEIKRFVTEIRSRGYQVLREGVQASSCSLGDLSDYLIDEEVAALRVSSKSALIGETLAGADIRNKYNVTVAAVRRKAAVISNPEGATVILAGDILICFGEPEYVEILAQILDPQ